MPSLPISLFLVDKAVLVVGGGTIALRKTRHLLSSGASVTVVALTVSTELIALQHSANIRILERAYSISDLESVFLAVAATDDPAVNLQIAENCRERGILVSIVDNPSEGDFIFPALLRHGDLSVAVSTDGKCPGYAAFIRDLIATKIDKKYGIILEQLASEREKLLTDAKTRPYNNKILRSRITKLLDSIISP